MIRAAVDEPSLMVAQFGTPARTFVDGNAQQTVDVDVARYLQLDGPIEHGLAGGQHLRSAPIDTHPRRGGETERNEGSDQEDRERP